MMIMIKDKGTVYLATDADNLFSYIHHDDAMLEQNIPAWKDKNGMLIGVVNDCCERGADMLRYGDILPTKYAPTLENAIDRYIPALMEYMEKDKLLDKDGDMTHKIMLAKGGKAIGIRITTFCDEFEDFLIYGRGQATARASLLTTKGEDPITRIRKAVACVEAILGEKRFPVIVMNTRSEERLILHGKED